MTTQSNPVQPTKKRISVKMIILFSVIGLIVLCIIFGMVRSQNPSEEATSTAESLTNTIAAIPTVTPTPTTTNTPFPTETPTMSPTNTPVPQPISYAGSGDKVIDIKKSWTGPSILKITNTGSSNFVVYNYDSNGNQISLLVNEIGAYQGKLIIDQFDNSEPTTRLQIQSSGKWTIQILPFDASNLESLNIPGHYDGKGSNLLFLAGKPDVGTFKATNDANFVVYTYSDSGRDLLINEIGPYSGEKILPSDTYLLEIIATGPWSIDVTGK
jgi:hypothetical protein